MIRWVPFLLFLLLMPQSPWCAGPESREPSDFLETRRVLATIRFDLGSAQLSAQAGKELESVAEKLKNLDHDAYIVRIEGFASPDGSDEANLDLSMARAMAVENVLARHQELGDRLFLTGVGADPDATLAPEEQRRVEIARYANPFNLKDDQGGISLTK